MVNKKTFKILGFLGLIILISNCYPVNKSFAQTSQLTADVVIAGAGTGGTAAAIQAARSGAKVILVEETEWVGGQMTAAGVTSIDMNNSYWGSGIYAEYDAKQKAYYGQSRSEPAKGQQFLRDLINAQPNIHLLTLTKVTGVTKSGTQITGVTLSNGTRISTKVLIDATEYGDILPLAGAAYRIGNSTNSSPNQSACIQDITYTSVIKRYPNGVPTELLISNPPPGYNDTVRQRFATITTKDSTNGWLTYPVSWDTHNSYRAMPNPDRSTIVVKTGVNWANDWPAPYPYIDYSNGTTLKINYLSDLNYRTSANCEAKLKTLQFMYYFQHDMGKTDWAISRDEGYDSTYNRTLNSCPNIPAELKPIEYNMPVIPYVRESRRLIGLYTLTAKDAVRTGTPPHAAKTFASSIAVGDYAFDLHNCSNATSLETSLETQSDNNNTGGPFQVPIESLISSNVTGLIAAEKNISVTRLVQGATRLQPITMLTGQAAGALAALSAKYNLAPKDVPVIKVQQELLKGKSILYPFTDVPTGNTYFAAIQEAALRGLMSGTSALTFAPTGSVTRAQTAVVLNKAFQIPSVIPLVATFADVPTNYWAFSNIEGFYKAGITAGCQANPRMFCPEALITNADLAVLVLKSWQYFNHGITSVSSTTQTFSDVPASNYAYTAVETLSRYGAIWKCGTNTFCPNAIVTRAQFADAIIRIVNNASYGSTGSTPSPTIRPTTTPGATTINKTGDINRDGHVDIIDIGIIIDNYNRVPVPNTSADLNHDGYADIIDIGIVIDNYGK